MLLIFPVSTFLIYKTINHISADSEGNILGEVSVQTQRERTETANTNFKCEVFNKKLYISEGRIYSLNLETGENLLIEQIESVQSATLKNNDELVFSTCSEGNCKINLYNFTTQEISNVLEFKAENINFLKYSYDDQVLAFSSFQKGIYSLNIFKNTSVSTKLYINGVNKESYEFSDTINIDFSPNNEKIVYTNTSVLENSPVISVVNIDKGVELEIKNKDNSRPSYAFFVSDEVIYYKENDKLFLRNIETDREALVSKRINGGFGFIPSPDLKQVAYYTYDYPGGITTLWSYDIASDSLRRLQDHHIEPVWADEINIISLKNEICNSCGLNKFEITGIDKININTKKIVEYQAPQKILNFKIF